MKIVLTGGPSAGKTSLVDILHRAESHRLSVVPEAASILFRGGFPRSVEDPQTFCQQRAIFAVQVELERIGELESEGRHLVCDRGTLDGLAYWPGDEESFFANMNSSMAAEIARYDWVIHLESASAEHYEQSPVRTETPSRAAELDRRVRSAWRLHQNRLIIPNNRHFLKKIDLATRASEMILSGFPLERIRKDLGLKTA